MKKLFVLSLFTIFFMSNVKAQTFKVGASLGLPVGEVADFSSFVLGVDAYYYFSKIDAPVEIGVTAGFRNFFGKEVTIGSLTYDAPDAQFLPIAAAARLKLFGILTGGADLGYALGINDGNDGGLYVRPVVGIDIADTIELNVSYESISNDGDTAGNLNLGILFEF